ncbi:MAG: hypothetical protein ACAI35_17610 [Candidatus Methylacidiphilales bacterium]
MLTILTLMLLAYFHMVVQDRTASKNYAQGIKAEQVATGALDYILGQLRTEMADGAPPMRVGSYSIYTNITSANIQPYPIGTDSSVPALVKISTAGLGISRNAPPGDTAATCASDTPSANGRRVTLGRWGRSGWGVPTRAPDWFLLTPDGVVQAPAATVQGRFACAIYDMGSLVDVNVAGFPSQLTTAQRNELGATLAGLDLSTLPGFNTAAADALVKDFRNRTTGATPGSYTNFVLNFGGTNGYLRIPPGDDTFLSRQDLLAYAKSRSLIPSMAHLTAFSRTVTTPSWGPATNAGNVPLQTITRSTIVPWYPQGSALSGTTTANFNYQTRATEADGVNRKVISQPVLAPFVRIDGTPAIVGEPLVLKRFPLTRLAWLSREGPSAQAVAQFGSAAGAAAKIKAAFGLVWDSTNRLWVYTSPSLANGGGSYDGTGNSDGPASTTKAAGAIKTLGIVAQENREPDFFELMKAGILEGSLGQRSSIASPVSLPQPGEVTADGHILHIGANIVDQYDSDDYPTLIRAYMPMVMDGLAHWYDSSEHRPYVLGNGPGGLTPHDFAGIENLPYLMDIRARGFRTQTPDPTGYRAAAEGLLIPQFWNPHGNASEIASARPAQLRFIQTFGAVHMVYMGNKEGGTSYIDPISGKPFGYAGYETYPPSEWPSAAGRPQPSITFRGSTSFAQPSFIRQGDVISTSIPENMRPAIHADAHTLADVEPTGMVGLYIGRVPAAGSDVVATTSAEALIDNTPVDRDTWSKFTGLPIVTCPVQQDIMSMALPSTANSTPLPPGDRFWKGDTAASAYNQRFPVFELQYLDNGVWKTYQRFDGLLRGGGSDHKWDTVQRPAEFAGSFTCESYAGLYARIDPRGSRFGFINSSDPANQYYNQEWTGNASSYRNTPPLGIYGNRGRPSGGASPGGIPGNQSGTRFINDYDPNNSWSYSQYWQWMNNNASGDRYTDADGTLRRADASTGAGVNPLGTGSGANGIAARPIMLNRAFTSVADLGYVSRDLPFKTLDFFSSASADNGLLDLFSINDTPMVCAGVLNLNATSAVVMSEVLSGAVTDETGGSALSATDAQSIAQGLATATHNDPLTGISDLPNFLESSDFTGAATGDVRNVKTRMESVPRRLTGIADTRCWNLLIDVVAQSGNYPAGAASPDQFIVHGERRYWLSVSIDRVTGKIIDQQLEPVWE